MKRRTDAGMKSYIAQRQWRLVGKAWEIRTYLRAQMRTESEEAKLAEFLEKRTASCGGSGCRREASAY
jgi:hypothetical protein